MARGAARRAIEDRCDSPNMRREIRRTQKEALTYAGRPMFRPNLWRTMSPAGRWTTGHAAGVGTETPGDLTAPPAAAATPAPAPAAAVAPPGPAAEPTVASHP